ncbi:MAG: DUF2330 domain-containing protein [Proteobacteria bacterium]|nr:DUF2330 domain-containing protein [Pseudomonadota bacterium]MCP4916698.1 DUF2330 domain-containing protein [Pseudomonadota bacterium]
MSLLFALSIAQADPCGMVPPIQLTGPVPRLERTGAQRTYVMHKRIEGVGGVETMVLRPGFTGSVEEFGMLIPFPSAPAIRKIEDDTFAHLEAAVDPPVVNVHLYEPYAYYDDYDMAEAEDAPRSVSRSTGRREEKLKLDEVRVVSQEAVGMYQVAVLEAGSPKALGVWMEDNAYQYPKGMDETVQDYVDSRWFFVAIKAKVGSADGANPAPGMRKTDTSRPAGSSFEGHVQGMGFRFRTDEPVVPMRLSVFNGEDPRNVVYMLSDDPVRLDDISDQLVVRQVDGEQVYQNLTEPLPVVFHNGTQDEMDPSYVEHLARWRDVEPMSGIARDLIAADLLAARRIRGGELSLEFEEQEKELLNISEAFGMRGTEADALHAQVIADERAKAVDGALDDLREMHLTVLDGVFPQQVLARQNLTFSTYEMPDKRNVARLDPIRPIAQTVSVPKTTDTRKRPW